MAGSAWTNQVVSLVIIQAGGNFQGLFVYSPSPGAGNLIASIAASAGTDPYGNSYPQGFAVNLKPSTDTIQVAIGSVSAFSAGGLSLTDTTNPPNVPAAVVGAGSSAGSRLVISSGFSVPGSNSGQITLSDTTELGTSDGEVQLQGVVAMLTTTAAPGTPSGEVLLYYHGGALIAKGPSGTPVTLATT